jgi:hypothetical protein
LGTKLGEASFGVAVGKTEHERDLMSYRYTYSFNKTDMRIAQRNGYELIRQALRVGYKQMSMMIARLLFQGSTGNMERVDIKGMLDVGEDVDAGLTAGNKWNTVTEPRAHCLAGHDDLVANSYYGPYIWILSANLRAGLLAPEAAGEKNHIDTCMPYLGPGGKIIYATNGTSTFNTIYPLPAASTTDGVWIMAEVGVDNFFMAQVTNGIETTPLEFDSDTNSYKTHLEWRGVPVFRNSDGSASSATYIVYEPDVDLAA